MPLTFNKVLREITAGKSKAIYFSTKSLWWTHLESDLTEATKRGAEFQLALAKREGRFLYVAPEHELTGPLGEEVKVFPNPALWMRNSQKFAKSFGRHKLTALMEAHHQNTSDFFSNKWEDYNLRIDKWGK